MSTGVLVTTAAGLVGVYTACFHGWVYALYRPAREHLWVALVGAAVALVCFGAAVLAASPEPAGRLLALRLQMVGAVGVALGLLRFGAARFGIAAPRLLRAADLSCAAAALLGVAAPGLLVALDRPARPLRGLAGSFDQFELTALGVVLLVPLLGLVGATIAFALRARRRGQPVARPLVVALAVWLGAALLDSATVAGLVDLPLLLASGGYPFLVTTLSAVLTRDLVGAMDESERLGEHLQRLALARAHAGKRAMDEAFAAAWQRPGLWAHCANGAVWPPSGTRRRGWLRSQLTVDREVGAA